MTKAAWLALLALALWCVPATAQDEIKTYEGVKLSPFHRSYDNSIRGPQKVDPTSLRLRVEGLVAKPLSLTYQQVRDLPSVKEVVRMPCVEGWTETLLYQGVRLRDLLALAQPKPEATWVMFHSAEGYSTGLPLKYLQGNKVLLGYKINDLDLDASRGWPFQLVAPGKLGYKWAKWIVRLELTAAPQKGFWEKRGYSNEADAIGR